ncbi:MAG: HAMP domain-containing protein [Albidovulum sp.]|nr:HAMP domain-containing protein [Albidovulum sp.]MDE0303755.1 HAMP domain-containing protein [Albidovulum sp.]
MFVRKHGSPMRGARRAFQERYRPFAVAALFAALVVVGPMLGQYTYAAFKSMNAGQLPENLARLLVADTLCFLLLFELGLLAVTKARGLGRPLELRLARMVAYAVLIPTAIVSIAAIRTIGVETNEWISSKVAGAFDDALEAANDYDKEMRKTLIGSSASLASAVNRRFVEVPLSDPGDQREILVSEQSKIPGGLKHVFLIDGSCRLIARGTNSYSFDILLPEAELMDRLRLLTSGDSVFSEASMCPGKLPNSNEFEIFDEGDLFGAIFQVGSERHHYVAVVPIVATIDLYLHTTLEAIPSINNLHATVGDDGGDALAGSQALFRNLGTIFSRYSILFLGFAVATAALVVWAGILLSRRLSRPLREISGVAERVAAGDMELKDIKLSLHGDNEIRTMAKAFEAMTNRLHRNATNLATLHAEAAERERAMAGVLSNVTSGVIGLDSQKRIVFANHAARELLEIDQPGDKSEGHVPIRSAAPELASLIDRLDFRDAASEGELINLERGGNRVSLSASISRICNESGETEGFVAAFDDVTDLLKLQQQSAWKEAAQRFAHDLGNPITPIMLAADYIKESMSPQMDSKKLERLKLQCDIIADESERAKSRIQGFRQYAEMPAPHFVRADLSDLVRRQAALEDLRNKEVKIEVKLPEEAVFADIDPSMISAALTNLLKNADESLRMKKRSIMGDSNKRAYRPTILVEVEESSTLAEIRVADNGIGLARASKSSAPGAKLGRGYGLMNVKHYVDSHGGAFELMAASAIEGCDHSGATARMSLPLEQERKERAMDYEFDLGDFSAFKKNSDFVGKVRPEPDE